jgi:MGT family glycosyltransferase
MTGDSARPARPGRFLIVTWAGGGNVPPLVALAGALHARGHNVRVLASQDLRDRFEAERVDFIAHRTRDEWTDGNAHEWPTPPSDEQRMAYLRGLADDVLTELARGETDAVIVDYMQPEALCAVEHAGVPLVAYVHTLYASVAAGPRSPIHMSGGLDPINQLRASLSLPALDALPDLLNAATRVLVVTTEAFDAPGGAVPANVRYVGPIVEPAGPDAGWSPPTPDDGTPLVHACTSTVAPPPLAAPVLQRILDATSELAVRVLMTAPAVTAAELRVPGNATIAEYVRHRALLPHVDLFVNHAGLSSVAAGVVTGVPMVCMPLFNEQPENAAAAQAFGIARVVATDAPVEEIREVIVAALGDDEMRRRCSRLASARACGFGEPDVAEWVALLAGA